jgi:hypothetical protein
MLINNLLCSVLRLNKEMGKGKKCLAKEFPRQELFPFSVPADRIRFMGA